MKRKVITLFLTFLLMISLAIPTFAVEKLSLEENKVMEKSSVTKENTEEQEKIIEEDVEDEDNSINIEKYRNVPLDDMINCLVNEGYDKDTAEALENEDILEIYAAIKSNKFMGVDNCCFEVDNIEAMETILNSSEEELEDMGMSENEIKETSEEVAEFLDQSDEELREDCDMTKAEIKMIRMAEEETELDQYDDAKKEIENQVDASGIIASSKLKYSMSKTSQSDSKPQYKINLSYNWKKMYLISAYKDCIAVAWGGDLNSKSEKGTAKYYSSTWTEKAYKSSKAMSPTFSPSRGCKFYFPQKNGAYKTKKGSASLIIYQNIKKKKRETKVVSLYAHRKLSASASITLTGAPSISVSSAYDKSKQKSKTIQY